MARFGLQIPNFSFGVDNAALFGKVAELATAAEEAGFDSVWVMDHLYQLPALGGAEQPMMEAYTTLGALAAVTQRVRLGALVTGVTYRNPAFLAKAVTTLDVISQGRAICGLGAAWHDLEHEAFGYEFPPAGERLSRLEEALQICRAMFTQEVASFDGTYYTIKDLRNVPRPVTEGGPPIMIGGGGEKRTLKLVAQYGDMCNFFGDPDTFRRKVSILHQHCEDAGRDPDEVMVTRLSTLIPTESPEQTEQMTKMAGAVPGRDVRAMNIGQEKEIIVQLEELTDAGVDYFIFNMPLSDVGAVRRAGEMLTAQLG
ncbi:MAG: TIGR03560 family F420-dependent LLM class oxidoreductase [Actinobacteria bacterium]|nr:TIGR03560 family F420-dependent LLM class oxidoreductase [Actinomycetota bacterium]